MGYMPYRAGHGDEAEDYIEEVRSGYDDEQQARLDAEMRRFNLAGQLLALRLAAGLTQAELAERAGLSQADISRYERGLGNPTRTTIEGIAELRSDGFLRRAAHR